MKEMTMPRGDKSSYTDKQKCQAEHIEESYEGRGIPSDEAERRAWATVNAETHGGKNPTFLIFLSPPRWRSGALWARAETGTGRVRCRS
jgi:hypothetical protein